MHKRAKVGHAEYAWILARNTYILNMEPEIKYFKTEVLRTKSRKVIVVYDYAVWIRTLYVQMDW